MIDEQTIESAPEQSHEVIQQPQEQLTKRDYDFAALRKKAEEAERRAYEAEQLLKQQHASQQIEEDDLTIDNEEYVQAKHVKTSTKNIKNKLKETEKKLADMEQKFSYLEAKIDTDGLKDFEDVVNDESLRKLAEKYGPDYRSMMMNPNLRERSRTAYNMIKNYGIQGNSGVDTRDIDRRIEQNKLKPQLASLVSPQQPATSTLAKFNDDGRRIMDEGERNRVLQDLERRKMSW